MCNQTENNAVLYLFIVEDIPFLYNALSNFSQISTQKQSILLCMCIYKHDLYIQRGI